MICKARLQKTFLEDGECEVSYVVYFIEFFGIGIRIRIRIRMYGGPGHPRIPPSSLQEIPNPDYCPG